MSKLKFRVMTSFPGKGNPIDGIEELSLVPTMRQLFLPETLQDEEVLKLFEAQDERNR